MIGIFCIGELLMQAWQNMQSKGKDGWGFIFGFSPDLKSYHSIYM